MNDRDSSLPTIRVRATPPDAYVVAAGELDLASTPLLAAGLNGAAASGCRNFHIDLAGVRFCDASTVGVLVSVDRHARAKGGRLRIVDASDCVQLVLRIVGLSCLLDGTGTVAISSRRVAEPSRRHGSRKPA